MTARNDPIRHADLCATLAKARAHAYSLWRDQSEKINSPDFDVNIETAAAELVAYLDKLVPLLDALA